MAGYWSALTDGFDIPISSAFYTYVLCKLLTSKSSLRTQESCFYEVAFHLNKGNDK